ncbi:TPA: hypothetical protein R5Z00_001722, partial [Campylobacter coli]|nr:hypothetical protein [Campylobacter coli]HED6603889.1 hypothetical protein [Campylobacter coli]
LLSVSSLVIAFVLFLAKNIKIVPYDEKKHEDEYEISTGFLESDSTKFDYMFGFAQDK